MTRIIPSTRAQCDETQSDQTSVDIIHKIWFCRCQKKSYIHLQADGIPGRWWRAWPTLQSIATPVRVKNQRTATPSTTEQIRSRDAGPAHISLMGNEEPSILQQYTKWLFPWMLPFQRRNNRGRKIANLHSAQQTAA